MTHDIGKGFNFIDCYLSLTTNDATGEINAQNPKNLVLNNAQNLEGYQNV
jgi:hypothetical protein